MNIDEHPTIPARWGSSRSRRCSLSSMASRSTASSARCRKARSPPSSTNRPRARPGRANPDIAEIPKEAEAVKGAEGDPPDAAAQIYAEVLSLDATNIPALAGLAKCYVTSGAIEQDTNRPSRWCRESKGNDLAVTAVQASIDLAEQAGRGRAGDRAGTESRRKPATRSSGAIRSGDGDQRRGQLRRGDQPAFEIVKRDRKWNEDAARKQLVQFFDSAGRALTRRPWMDESGCQRKVLAFRKRLGAWGMRPDSPSPACGEVGAERRVGPFLQHEQCNPRKHPTPTSPQAGEGAQHLRGRN